MNNLEHHPKFFDESEIARWQQQGTLFVISHPDDEILFKGAIDALRSCEIPVHIHSLTHGENGQIDGLQIKRKKTKKIRKKEFKASMDTLEARGVLYHFKDGEIDKGKAKKQVLRAVREVSPAAIFSFHPHEITQDFDHPDHTKAGKVTRFAATFADNARIGDNRKKHPPLTSRPHLFFWTTKEMVGTIKIEHSDEFLKQRADHLVTHYPSQFPDASKDNWQTIFDHHLGKTEGKSTEMYIKIR